MIASLLVLVVATCTNNIYSNMCRKTFEAQSKYEGYWDYSSKLGTWAAKNTNETAATILATSALAARDKKLNLAVGQKTRYTMEVDKNSGIFKISWRIE